MPRQPHSLTVTPKQPQSVPTRNIIEPRHEKTCLKPYANIRDADQPLIGIFDVRCLDSITPTVAKSKISRLKLASVAEKAILSLTWS